MSMSWMKFREVYPREAMLDVGGRWWLYWSTRFQEDFSIEVRKYSLLLIYSGYINLSSYERFISLIFSPTSQNVWSQTHRNISFRITSKIRVWLSCRSNTGMELMISCLIQGIFLDSSFCLSLWDEVVWFYIYQNIKSVQIRLEYVHIFLKRKWQCGL